MRLRQVALASDHLDEVVTAFADVFGLKVAYNDPGVGHYGLRNAVLSAGPAFLEVVEPVREDASAARFIKRRGDAGYMVILQDADAAAHRARVLGLGVRVVDDIDRRDYRASHFHPADFGGVLVSIDEQRNTADYLEPYGDWMPAGPDWRATRTDEVLDLTGITLTAPDPDALARRWSELLDQPLDPADSRRLPLTRGEIRFAGGPAGQGTSIAAIELKVADLDATLRRAGDAGLDVTPEGILIGGVRFRAVR
jgi:hypothetical protein